jgi:hypothetical protein
LHRAISTRCVSRLAPVTLVASGNSNGIGVRSQESGVRDQAVGGIGDDEDEP